MADTEDEDNAATETAPVDPQNLKSSKGWLALISRAEKAFDTWQKKSDAIDKLYASLERLSGEARDREFQLFWANVQVLGPSIYSRPPVPVVVPRFKDNRPIPRVASEMLERSCIVTFENESIDEVMRGLRDDLTVVARGAAWVRYDTTEGEYVCCDHVDRGDFLHDPARKWKDVDWVAKRSWLTRKEARKRFKKTSGDAYQTAGYEVRKDEITGDTDGKLKAGFWELWSKSEDKVVWIADGVEVLLDEGAPHLTLEGFFPCPRPAYGTTQRGSLVPVPDILFYKDQLEEINEFTARISALAEGLRLRGFYPAGAGEIADAVEAALKNADNRQVLVGISNWAMLGGGAAKDMIVWLPLEMVATTVTTLIELRKQLIDDVYQITGLSDIMRGSTVASETLGAQQLKAQYGSVRIRDRQDELVRVARDLTRITAEIMAENFSGSALLAMSQMDIPSDADIEKQAAPLEQQLKALIAEFEKAKRDPEVQQMVQQQPDKAKQVLQQAQQQAQQLHDQLSQLRETVTIEQVMKFLRDERIRAFTLDIETDSTIAPDEDAAKQRATEYITAITPLIREVAAAVQTTPQVAPLAADMLKYVNGVFRVGREFEQTIDEFTDQMKQLAANPPQNTGPSAEQLKAQSDGQKAQMAAQKQESDARQAQADAVLAGKQLELDTAIAAKNAEIASQRVDLDRYKAELAAATTLQAAEISARATGDQGALQAHVEAAVGAADQQHELTVQAADHAQEQAMQAADQQHQQAQQESAQQASAQSQASAQAAAAEQAQQQPQGGQ